MATKTFEELKQLAIQIRDEKTNKQNTATRIGTQMLEHLDKLEQDYYDKTATDEELKERDEKLTELELEIGIYDIDKIAPLEDGSFYTLSTAIAATPDAIKYKKKSGLIIFGTGEGTSEIWKLKNGQDWWGDTNWVKLEPDMFYKLKWNSNVNTTLNSLPYYSRKKGMIISYIENDVEKYFLYIGDNYATSTPYYNNFIRLIMYDEYYSALKSAMPFYRDIVLTDYSAKKDGTNSTGSFKGYEIDLAKLRNTYNVYKIIFRSSCYLLNNNIVNYVIYNNDGTIIDYYASNKGNYTNEWNSYVIKDTDAKIRITYLPTTGDFGEGYAPEGCYILPKEFEDFVSKNDTDYKELGSLNQKLYGIATIVFEDKDTQSGSQDYEYSNIGLVHKASVKETFQKIQLYILQPSTNPDDGELVVKKGTSVTKDGGEVLYQERVNSSTFPQYPQMMSIILDTSVTLNEEEKLWVYFTGKCKTRRYTATEQPNQTGMYFQGSESSNKSTSMILSTIDGDIPTLKREIEEIQGGNVKIMSYFPTDLYVPVKTRQTFYFNQMMLGDESRTDDSLLNFRITIQFPSQFKSKCWATDEGFSIYHDSNGEFMATINVYNSDMDNVLSHSVKIHVVSPPSSVSKNILMMGASWIDITANEGGYVYFLDKALKEQGVTLNFVGSKTTVDSTHLKYEAVGGSDYKYWCGENSPFYDSELGRLNVTKYRTQTLQMSEQFDIVYIQLGGNEASGGNIFDESSFDLILWQYAEQLYNAILEDSPNCKIFVYLPSNCSPGMTGWSNLNISTGGVYGKLYSTYIINTLLIKKISERVDFNINLFLSQDHYGLSRRHGFGYIDARYRFFKVDMSSMTEEDKNKMINYDYVNKSVYMTTNQSGFGEFNIRYYDKRGYIVAQIQRGLQIGSQNELIVNSNSVSNNSVPEAGTLVKSGGSTSEDYPDIPFTEVLLENNEYKRHWYTNGTHPSIGGYEQLGYCNAAQLLYYLVE